MKKLLIVAAVFSMFVCSSMATAAPLLPAIPLPEWFELDLDNWTRLYRGGSPVEPETTPQTGDMSRAFITFADISPTAGPGGTDFPPPVWTAGTTDGTFLHGWEDNVVIQQGGIILQNDGSANLYFTHADDTSFEFVVYQTTVTSNQFINIDPDYLPAGPTMFNTIQGNLAAPDDGDISEPFLRGRFSESVYTDPFLNDPNGDGNTADAIDIGFGPGLVNSLVGINVPDVNTSPQGGLWFNQDAQPFGLGVNAFVNVDPTWGMGAQFVAGAYGFGPNGDSYDVAIQGVTLNTETNDDGWIVSDDAVRASGAIPEPATMLLLGTGLVGVAGVSRRRRKNQA